MINNDDENDEVLLLGVAASNDVVVHLKDDKNVFLRVVDKSI
ncbi:hypothetical protein FHX77_001154 [Bifidobacterium commune]|nr:hypothetical protein [Bifidobacterium commune]